MDTRKQLNVEYQWEDRYWTAIYPSFQNFIDDYHACETEFEAWRKTKTHRRIRPRPASRRPSSLPQCEPPEEVKEQVKSRDGYRCRCCGR